MDIFSNQEQLRLLLQSLLLGVGTGLLYDILRALRRHFVCGRAAAAVLDTVFWAILSAGVFEFGIVFAAGQPRLFVLAGAACGIALYLVLLSEAVLAVLGAALRAAAYAWQACRTLIQHAQNVLQLIGIPEKIRHFAKKNSNYLFHFSQEGYKIKTVSVRCGRRQCEVVKCPKGRCRGLPNSQCMHS